MALQGTIDSFPLVDVLALLASSRKSGRLSLVGDRGRGAVWLSDGELTAGEVTDRVVAGAAEAVWELLRFADGSFEFIAGDEAPSSAFEPADVAAAVDTARAMLEEWAQVEHRIPSPEHAVTPVADLPGGEVRLTAADWSVIVRAGRSRNVSTLLEELDLGEFEGCSRLSALVDRGLLEVSEPTVVAAPATAAPAPPPAPEPAAAPPEQVRADEEPPAAPADPVPVDGPAGPAPAWDVLPVRDAVEEPGHRAAGAVGSEPPPGFPERFPIDDLVEDPAPDFGAPGPAPGAHQIATEPFGDVAPAPVVEPLVTAEPLVAAEPGAAADPRAGEEAPAAEDDVLAQIGRLSPKAAEAIAAALGEGDGHRPGIS